MELITVVIADDITNTREDVKRLLFFEEDIQVVGEAGDGDEALHVARELQPDVILMDINMPGVDGISATEMISEQVPHSAVVIISIQGEQEYLRKAMAAGASEFLMKPFSSQDLADAVRRVNEKAKRRRGILLRLQEKPEAVKQIGRVVVVFGSKGGIGRSTITSNLAVVLSQEFHQRVIVVDLDTVGADVPTLLNVKLPGSITELAREAELSKEAIEGYVASHLSGVRVLGAIPSREEDVSDLNARIPDILRRIRLDCDWVLVDTPPVLNAAVAYALDLADEILLIGQSDLPALKRLKADVDFLEINQLEDKVRVVLNNAFLEGAFKPAELEKNLGLKFASVISGDAKTVQAAANKGVPFVFTSKNTRVAQDLRHLAERLTGKEAVKEEKRFRFGKVKSG